MKLTRGAASVNRALRLIDPGSPACTESDSRFRQKGGKVARHPSPQSPVFSSRTRCDILRSSDWPASFFGRGEICGACPIILSISSWELFTSYLRRDLSLTFSYDPTRWTA
jgi:hypothetical protein